PRPGLVSCKNTARGRGNKATLRSSRMQSLSATSQRQQYDAQNPRPAETPMEQFAASSLDLIPRGPPQGGGGGPGATVSSVHQQGLQAQMMMSNNGALQPARGVPLGTIQAGHQGGSTTALLQQQQMQQMALQNSCISQQGQTQLVPANNHGAANTSYLPIVGAGAGMMQAAQHGSMHCMPQQGVLGEPLRQAAQVGGPQGQVTNMNNAMAMQQMTMQQPLPQNLQSMAPILAGSGCGTAGPYNYQQLQMNQVGNSRPGLQQLQQQQLATNNPSHVVIQYNAHYHMEKPDLTASTAAPQM
ncbi:unnamed protein product, partial [Amoebophrya sp. A120]